MIRRRNVSNFPKLYSPEELDASLLLEYDARPRGVTLKF